MISAQDFVQVLRSTNGNKKESCFLLTPTKFYLFHKGDTEVNGDTRLGDASGGRARSTELRNERD